MDTNLVQSTTSSVTTNSASRKRKPYAGWGYVLATVKFNSHMTAVDIAKTKGVTASAVRWAAKKQGIVLPPSPRGGKRYPSNQYIKAKIIAQ